MTLIPIQSLANGTIFQSVPFVGSQNPTGAQLLSPAAGVSVEVYLSGTTTPATVYSDAAGLHPAAMPLTTSGSGAVPGYVDVSTLPLDLAVNGETFELPALGGGGSVTKAAIIATGLAPADIGAATAAGLTAETARAETAEGLLAPLASPALTGNPTAPTQAGTDSSTRLATTAFVKNAISVPYTVDTPENHGAKRDGRVLSDVTVTNATKVMASPSNPFAAGDVGKTVMIANPASGASFVTTIASFTDSGHVVLTAGPGGDYTTTSAVYSTDDTAAIAAAQAAVVAAAQANGTNHAVLQFSAGVYGAHSPTTKGGATLGNAQIPLPVISSAIQKVTLELRGVGDANADPHWQQGTPQAAGAVVCSTITGANDGTWGFPSVFGGPTPQGLGSTDGGFSNLYPIVSGLSIVCPYNPTLNGFDFRQQCGMGIVSASCIPFATASQLNNPAAFTNGAMGCYSPVNQNNDFVEVLSFVCFGFNYGINVAEHFNAKRLQLIYCNTPIWVSGAIGSSSQHGGHIAYASCEEYVTGLDASGGSNPRIFPLVIELLDFEGSTGGTDIKDPANSLMGEIRFYINTLAVPHVNGAANVKIKNVAQPAGQVAAPSVPATTVPLTNPFWRDAAVNIGGGGLTAVSVDGQAMSVVPGTYIVPSGKSITLTYTGTVSWSWVLL